MASFIEVKNLKKYFNTKRGVVHAVDDVSLTIEEGSTMGLVGESGCGKSTLGRTIVHLLESTAGKMYFREQDVTKLKKKALKAFREEMQMIFQDPFSSLNPRMTVKATVREPLYLSGKYKKEELDDMALQVMERVGIEKRFQHSFPHELDGGRRQRVGIARALAVDPKFIVCDEPVSALDVSIQAQILNLLMDLQEKDELTYLFVTHNLSVVNHFSDDIMVMYLGRIAEKAPAEALFTSPLHPYTQVLLSAIPVPRLRNRGQRILIKGEISSPINPKPICRFVNRCHKAIPVCSQREPELNEVAPNHFVACHLTRQ